MKLFESKFSILLNIIIIILIIYNSIVFTTNITLDTSSRRKISNSISFLKEKIQPKQSKFSTNHSKYPNSPLHLPPAPEDINYTQEELQEAIKGLNIPIWSRSYVPCDDSRSEITCTQVIKAFRVLNNWSKHIERTKFEDTKHFYTIHKNFGGVGNRFATDMATFLIALMQNRSFVINSVYPRGIKYGNGQAFQFQKNVILLDENNEKTYGLKEKNNDSSIDSDAKWYTYDYETELPKKDLYFDRLLYATTPYLNSQLSEFARIHFGMHAAYFISNFLTKIPEKNINYSKKLLEKVPPGYRVFGVHLRFQNPGQFYSYNTSATMKTVTKFLKQKLEEKPTIFIFASDSATMETEFMKEFANNTISANVIRIPDYDHDSALLDITLLEMCDECLLTYRSTFSYVCAMRTGKRAWFVEKESNDVFQASNSQATAISVLYHQHDINDWQLNRRVHVNDKNEEALRYYFKYLLI